MTASDDLSSRYVLTDDAPYLANLASLWAIEPTLAAAIEDLDEVAAYQLEPTREGSPTVAVAAPAAAGRKLYLHSRYDPIAEAATLIATIETVSTAAFYIFGFGLGYHVELLFEQAGEEAVFCIFEPDLLLLQAAFESRDLSKLIESRRLMFFTKPDKADLLTRLTPQTALLSIGVETVEHQASLQACPAFHAQMKQWLDEFESFSTTSINTLVLNSTRTAENIARNIGWYAASPGVGRLRDRHKNRPAVIVSAGPSLRKNKHLLKGLRERAVIIAVQTTLQPLLEMGVEPHFVTSLDYHEICTRFFEKVPRSISTELVAEPKASNAIFSMFGGPISLLGNEFADGLLREMALVRPRLPGGATVAHLAYYLAEHMGCDPIMFVGQDLGFSDGLCYTPGTSYEDVWRPELSRCCSVEMKQWEQIVRERFILRRVSDYQGRPMYTEERLFTYLQQFERDFLKTSTRIVDATEGGVAKRGAIPMPLAEAIDQFCTAPLSNSPESHPGMDFSRMNDCVDCLRRRRGEAVEIGRISRNTLPLLREIHDHLDDQQRVNHAIGAIDGLRARMNELGATYDLVTQLSQPGELKRFTADRKIAASRVSGVERQRQQVKRDIENVEGILAATENFQRLMDEVIDKLDHGEQTRTQTRAA